MGLPAVVTPVSRSPGCPLLLRHKASRTNLHRGIRFHPAAFGQYSPGHLCLFFRHANVTP